METKEAIENLNKYINFAKELLMGHCIACKNFDHSDNCLNCIHVYNLVGENKFIKTGRIISDKWEWCI